MRHTAEALMNVEIKSRFLESSFWSDIHQQVEHQADPPENVYSSMLTVLHHPIAPEKSHRWLEDALTQETNNEDTHPCLKDRLEALGYGSDRPPALPQPIGRTSAAEQLLGTALKEWVAQFDRDWQQTASTPWRQRYGYLQKLHSRLAVLERTTTEGPPSNKDAWERAYCTLELRGHQAALPLLEEVLKIDPDFPEANYTLGQIRLKNDDETGIACIEKAIAQKIDWVIEGCEWIYNFLIRHDRTQEAQKYRDRAENHYRLLQEAQQERAGVSGSDPLKPHTLNESELRKLTDQLANYPQVKQAYLVEKAVAHFPDKRFCILGIDRKRGFIESEQAAHKLVDRLAENLHCPTQTYIIILDRCSSGTLKKNIRQLEGALIFRR